MVKRFLIYSLIGGMCLSSCVSSKVYNDLESSHEKLQAENQELDRTLNALEAENKHNLEELSDLRASLEEAQNEIGRLRLEYENTSTKYEALQNSYDALEANSSSALTENSRRNRELLAALDTKEKALAQERERLSQLEEDLAARAERVTELEQVIAAKDAKMNALKNAISAALVNFEGKGLTVVQRDGKVYVSMENKLLFNSGSWAVGSEGKQAVKQLASVLADNSDIAVLIEGHTDNVPYGGSGDLNSNWDLSTKRATAIVQLLQENENIDPQNLTAAGRGEFAPLASNDTAEGRAKNRRIEVILTPKLDKISKLLEEMD